MKKLKKEDMLLYVVTDRSLVGTGDFTNQVEQAIRSGATMVQLREKDMSYEAFIKEAINIKLLADRYQIPLIINDSVEVAIACDATGVHLGQGDLPIAEARMRLGKDKLIGLTAHNVEEAIAAQQSGADYIGVGAVFGTTTKKDAMPMTRNTLIEICESVTIPIVAIGGITRDNIMQLSGTGVDGVAVISAIFAQQDIAKATREMAVLAKAMVASGSMKLD